MMRFARTGSWCTALAFSLITILTACTDEQPTNIGGDLLPGGDIATFEVFLEPGQYMTFDTAFSGYMSAWESDARLAAREFEGVYNANTLVKLPAPPASISVRNAQGSVVNDSAPRYFAGNIIVRVDTLRSTNKGIAPIAVYTTAEAWDEVTANWTHRVDTTGARLPWSQPGGSTGVLLGRAARTKADSIFIPIDSATIASLRALDANVRGAIIKLDPDAAGTLGERMRFGPTVTLRLQAHSTIDTDTVVTVNIDAQLRTQGTFVYEPQPATTAAPIRVGGIPAWRTIMEFRHNLSAIEVPCLTVSSTCRVRLADAGISRAEFVLETTPPPAGFVPEDSLVLVTRMVMRSPNVPLARSPLAPGNPVGGTLTPISPAAFRAQTPATARIDMTNYFRVLVADSVETSTRPSRTVAILTNPESTTAGFATFQRLPRLRLILTVDPEKVR